MKLIIALDVATQSSALALVEQLDPTVCALKVGHELFTRFGEAFIRVLVKRQFKVFLDLKFHDIPNTVAEACKAAADCGVWMMNVHALGGLAMMQAAKHALSSYGPQRPLLIAVTVLTSLSEADLSMMGLTASLTDQCVLLARLAQRAGLDGVVSSALEVPFIKAACGAPFLTVTPGIRLADDARHDQVRCVSPAQAIELGSDYLVVGRSITQSAAPMQSIQRLLQVIS
jgi:orotidine-5'-phosphate decarboxylase